MKIKIAILKLLCLLRFAIGIADNLDLYNIRNIADRNLLIQEETIFSIKAGTGSIELGEQLYSAKVINSPLIFQLLLLLYPELSNNVKAGTYKLKPGMTVRDMLQLLEIGKEAQFPLLFLEGMRLSDYLKKLRYAPYIKHTLKDDNYKTVANALKLEQENPELIEGWFWPDTWMYTAGTTDIAILKRAHNKMVAEVERSWERRMEGLPYKDKNQFVTMASIIEKETAILKERNIVASVFINRLRIGMPLQTDPTVIYGMGAGYNGNISRKHLETPTAYNTYVISGLPPGPIATPSQASLDAAAHPAKTSYLYFVADGEGRHTFNTNLASHNRSVKNYLKAQALKD